VHSAERIVVELDRRAYDVTLMADRAPHTCRALRAQLPISGEFFHAMWSGWLGLLLCELRGVPLENPTTYLGPGDVVYHPQHHEIGICYRATQFKEPHGPSYVNLFGQLQGDLSHLQALGCRLQITGAKPVRLR
jgi:hypothetical protein